MKVDLKSLLLSGIILTILTTFCCEKEVIKVKEDTIPPIITSGPEILQVTDFSSTIFWITDEPCSVQVKYAISTSSDTITQPDSEFRQNHLITLTNLNPNTIYNYKTVNFDVSGNITESNTYTFTTEIDRGNLLSYGWDAFENGYFLQAAGYFDRYIQLDSLNAECFTGLGWSIMRIDSLDSSITSFNNALNINEEYIDALAGLVLALYKKGEDLSVTLFGEQVLLQDSVYVFEHDTSFNYEDIHLTLADSYNLLGMREDAQIQVDFIFPENGLVPDDSASWVVDNITYSTYEEALTAVIEYLKNLFWNSSSP